MTQKELIETPPSLYCGGEYREKKYNKLFYGNMHGEDIIRKDNQNWAKEFIHRFATYQIPCHFLNAHKRLSMNGSSNNLSCMFADDINSFQRVKESRKTTGQLKMATHCSYLLFIKKNSI